MAEKFQTGSVVLACARLYAFSLPPFTTRYGSASENSDFFVGSVVDPYWFQSGSRSGSSSDPDPEF